MSTVFTHQSYRAPLAKDDESGWYYDLYFDRHARVWTCIARDAEGNQIGDAEYLLGARGLKEAVAAVNHFRNPPLTFTKILL